MKGRQMRWLVCAFVVLGFAPHAFAQDYDVLRGSQPVGPAAYTNWTGFYVGGHFGYGDASGDFSNSTSSVISYALRETTLEAEFDPSAWPVLGMADARSTVYGGFVGYNTQWQDLVLSVEANYVQTQFSLVAPTTPIGRITPADANGIPWTVVLTGTGTVTNLDYATLRGRAGLIFDNFLPYGFIGLAVGNADLTISAVGYAEGNAPTSGSCSAGNTPPCYYVGINQSTERNTFLYGLSIGGGFDFALTQHFFLRGEFEYVRFAPESDIVIAVTSARGGAGFKF
jgi:opacity protein-like surface antigen